MPTTAASKILSYVLVILIRGRTGLLNCLETRLVSSRAKAREQSPIP